MRFLVLILVAAAATAGSASAGSFYYPKRAYFRMSVSGTQTTAVKVTTACQDENGHETPKTASGTETLRFKTGKPGRVLFKTDPHGGMIVFQEDASFEDGVRPARATGSVERSSGLDNRRGSSAPDCGFGGPASGCGTKPFSGWRLSLDGRGRKLKVGLRSPGPAGGRLFPKCPLRYDDSAAVVDKRVARVSKSAVYSKRRKLVLTGSATVRAKLVDDYANSKGTVVTKLKFKVRLVRNGGSGF